MILWAGIIMFFVRNGHRIFTNWLSSWSQSKLMGTHVGTCVRTHVRTRVGTHVKTELVWELVWKLNSCGNSCGNSCQKLWGKKILPWPLYATVVIGKIQTKSKCVFCFFFREFGQEMSAIRVGFVTYSTALHFYNVKVGLSDVSVCDVYDNIVV